MSDPRARQGRAVPTAAAGRTLWPRRAALRALAFVEITRPATSLAAPVLALLSVRLAVAHGTIDEAGWGLSRVAGLAIGWLVLAQAVFAINDYFDASIDAVSHPWRPIPSGRIAPAEALWLGGGLALAGTAILALVSGAIGLVALAYAVVSWLYSSHLKSAHGIAGNVAVAGLIALVPLAVAVGEPAAVPPAWFTIAVFLGVLAREVLNDIEDVEGDRLARRPTLPLRFGCRAAYRTSAALWIGFALAIFSPAVLSPQPRPIGYLVATGAIGASVVAIVTILLRERREQLGRLQVLSKVLLIGPAVAMLVFPLAFV